MVVVVHSSTSRDLDKDFCCACHYRFDYQEHYRHSNFLVVSLRFDDHHQRQGDHALDDLRDGRLCSVHCRIVLWKTFYVQSVNPNYSQCAPTNLLGEANTIPAEVYSKTTKISIPGTGASTSLGSLVNLHVSAFVQPLPHHLFRTPNSLRSSWFWDCCKPFVLVGRKFWVLYKQGQQLCDCIVFGLVL
ncbi:hypothetical protein BJ742DRAFT_558319 [Cladochytrium replicatum]|nr:hypothetical protein BJ742DRAFT_558319 [Cladochytrium replicatum]